MKTFINGISVVFVATTLLLSGCSKFSRIQKSTDMAAKNKAAIEYYEKKKYFQALQLFEELITVFRGTARAEDTYFYYSQCYFESGDYIMAAYHFNNFYQTYPSSPKAEEALFKNAYCYFMDSPPASLDQKSTYEAIRQFQLFINRFPSSSRVPECNEYIDKLRFKIETKEFNNAMLYYRTRSYKASMIAFQNVIKTFPATTFREECLYYIVKSSYAYAGRSIEVRQKERYQATMEHYLKLVDAFPTGKYLKEAEKIYEDCRLKLEKATPASI